MNRITFISQFLIIGAIAIPQAHSESFCEQNKVEVMEHFGINEDQLETILMINGTSDENPGFENSFKERQAIKDCQAVVRAAADTGAQQTIINLGGDFFSIAERKALIKTADCWAFNDADLASVALIGRSDRPWNAMKILEKYLPQAETACKEGEHPDLSKPKGELASMNPTLVDGLSGLVSEASKDPSTLNTAFDLSGGQGDTSAVPHGDNPIAAAAPYGDKGIAIAAELGALPAPPLPQAQASSEGGFFSSLWGGIMSVANSVASGISYAADAIATGFQDMYNGSPVSRAILVGGVAFSAVALIATGIGAAPGAAILFGLWAGGTFGVIFGANFPGEKLPIDDEETITQTVPTKPIIERATKQLDPIAVPKAESTPTAEATPLAATPSKDDRMWTTTPGTYRSGGREDTLSAIVNDYYPGLTASQKKRMMQEIGRMNNLPAPYHPRAGKQLKLPVDPTPYLKKLPTK